MINRINPDKLPDSISLGYSQISIVEEGGVAYVSGQVAIQRDGEPVPTDLADQTKIVVANLRHALDAIDANPTDIALLRIYIVDLDDEKLNISFPIILEFLNGSQPSVTGIGVSALAGADLKIEVEMTVRVQTRRDHRG